MFGNYGISNTQLQQLLVRSIMNLLQEVEGRLAVTRQPLAAGAALPGATAAAPSNFDALISQAAQRYQLDPALVKAVVQAESNFNSQAVSGAGAQGLMQLMPGTAAGLGVNNPLDPAQNLDGGARLLRQLLNRYDQNVSLALAAYNAGPGAVDKYGGIPPYAETQTYVPRILGYYRAYQTGGGA